MKKVSIDEIDVNGKRVLVRVDFNVPLNEDGSISDDSRIKATLPTIQNLLERGAKVILMSHMGRPKGEVVQSARLKPAGDRLSELLGRPVDSLQESVGEAVEARVNAINPGEVTLLENLRFNKGEEGNAPEFAAALARLADCYVNDAFGAAHREHASVSSQMTSRVGVCAAGLLVEKEIQYFSMALEDPPRPFYAVLGGAKVRDKIAIIRNLLDKVDGLIIGGGMSYTFQAARERTIGRSLYDETSRELSGSLLRNAADMGVELLLPEDYLIIKGDFDNNERRYTSGIDIPEDWEGVDIGPKTVARFSDALVNAKCVLWNGPMGVFEKRNFSYGTCAVAVTLAGLTMDGGITILGGGDTAAAAAEFGISEFSHISTGGGASLEFLGGHALPGIEALPDKS
ncbi:MAG: phosphoglycerate kinase [Planctomycetota bacterium]|nr:phosphoglycerate kinase [Planctomycetota bacterium]